MLEDMIGKMKQAPTPQKFIVLFDLRGFSVSLIFRKDVRLMIRKLIYIAQAQYPERLHKALLVGH
jgi:CRAL/TRIO domain